MTLCIVWRNKGNIHFFSDSRLTFNKVTCDVGIKICRVPYNIYEPGDNASRGNLAASGDLGMTFAGSSVVALMMKEALIEIVNNLTGVPDYHKFDMDEISYIMHQGFTIIAKETSKVLFEGAATCVIFSGYCKTRNCLRTFKMQLDTNNQTSIIEIMKIDSELEVFGSGKKAFENIFDKEKINNTYIYDTLKKVILDENIPDVGGNIQYGEFKSNKFQPIGVAEMTDDHVVHYWRGPIDFNSPEFDANNCLVPGFPVIDMVSKS